MKLFFQCLLILTLSSELFSQKIKDLEFELSWYKSTTKEGSKIDKARTLLRLDPMNFKATEYICKYYFNRNIDSFDLHFEFLFAQFPTNPRPYYYKAELAYLDPGSSNKTDLIHHQVHWLKQGLALNPQDTLILYELCKNYYQDFIAPMEIKWAVNYLNEDGSARSRRTYSTKENSKLMGSADSALIYFYRLWEHSHDSRAIIYYPIRQLECYLQRSGESPIPDDYEQMLPSCYLPASYFVHLPENWACDSTVDYLNSVEYSKLLIDLWELQLRGLKEECLYGKEITGQETIYRFTWLSAVYAPVAIRIEKDREAILIFWKVGKGYGTGRPSGLKKSGKKKLNLEAWEQFEALLKMTNFENAPKTTDLPEIDGATWTLEKKQHLSFIARQYNSPNESFEKACLYLAELAGLRKRQKRKA